MTNFFTSAAKLRQRVDTYFNSLIKTPEETTEKTIKTGNSPKPETLPATISGLMLFLGFNSRKEYDDYENYGKYNDVLKRARLRIEAEYEKKLHYQSSTGAIFALKNLGWNDREENKDTNGSVTLNIEILNSEYNPAVAENEVIL